MKKEKQGLRFFVRRELGPEYTVAEAAQFIDYTETGMRKLFKSDERKLKALFIGYKTLKSMGHHGNEASGAI